MKIEVHNLGVTKHAEIDLKPLTVFIGPNNTGKTWVAYTLAAILGYHGWQRYLEAYTSGKTKESYPDLSNVFQQLLERGNAKLDLVTFAETYWESYVNDIACLASHWMNEFMGAEKTSFKDLEVHITLGETKDKLLKNIKKGRIEGKLSVGQKRGEALLHVLKEEDSPILYFYTSDTTIQPFTEETSNEVSETDLLFEDLPNEAIRDFLSDMIFETLHRNLYPAVRVLPTERTTYITFPLETLATKSKRGKGSQLLEQSIAQIKFPSRPALDLLRLIRNAAMRNLALRKWQTRENAQIQTYIALAEILEKDILGGTIHFSTPDPKPDVERELLFQPGDRSISLDIAVASSMVKELTPLVLYLRYLAQPGELLIIDEPEMNLHPKAQVQMIEFLALLVNAGLHILITTHSSYMVDHLVNLMKAAKHEHPSEVATRFFLKRTEAFIPQKDVSVYLFENGISKNILNQEGLVDWGTFGQISERVEQIYFEI